MSGKSHKETNENLFDEPKTHSDQSASTRSFIPEYENTESLLSSLSRGLSPKIGEEFFRSLVHHVATTLNVRIAYIGELSPDNKKVRTIAFWKDHAISENIEYDLAGTPCEHVAGKSTCIIASNLRQKFPKSHLITEMGVESFLGVPLDNSAGDSSGLLVIMDDKPMPKTMVSKIRSLIEIYASRATAELKRMNTEKALRESENKYRSLIENSPGVFWTSDEDGHTSFISKNIEDIYGYTPEEIYRGGERLWFGRIHPDDIDNVKHSFAALIENNQSFDIQYRVQKKDGNWIWLQDKALKAYDHMGKIRVDGIFSDITNRKQSEEVLHNSEEKYRRLVESLERDYFMYSHDVNGVFTYLSPSITNILGYSQEDFLNHYDTYLTDNPLNQAVMQHTEASIRGEKQPPYEVEIFHKDGSIHLLEVTEHPVFDEQGNVLAVEGIAHDVTENKKMEEELLKSEEKFSKVFHSSPDPATLTSLKTGQIVEVNKGFERMFGFTREEMLGETTLKLGLWHNPADRDRMTALIEENGVIREMELEICTKSGKIVTSLFSAEQVEIQGKRYLLSVAHDITERKQAEEALRASEEKLKSITTAANDVILMADNLGKIVYWNPAAEKVFGYDENEVYGHEMWKTIFPDRYAEELSKRILEFGKTGYHPGIGNTFEIAFKRKNNDEFPAELSLSALKLDNRWHSVAIIRDISERKLAEEEIKKERDRANQYFNIAGTILIALDRDETITAINQKGCEVLGCSEQEILGKNWFDNFLLESERDEVKNVFKLLMQGEIEPVEFFENKIVIKNSKERIIAWHNSVIKNASGEITGILSSGQDITEKKLTKKALEESEERYRAFFQENVSPVLWLEMRKPIPVDLPISEQVDMIFQEAYIKDCSDMAAQIYGFKKREDLIGKLMTTVWSPESTDRDNVMHQYFQEFVRAGYKLYGAEVSGMTQAGGNKWFLKNAKGIIENDCLIRIWGSQIDITEQKQAEEKLGAIADYTYDWESWFSPDGRLLWLNPAVEKLTGYSSEECREMSDYPLSIVHKEDRAEFEKRLKKALGERSSINDYAFRVSCKDGLLRWMAISWQPIYDEQGEHTGLRTSVRDTTERKKNEKAIQLTNEILRTERETLAEKNNALGEMLHQIDIEKKNMALQIQSNVDRIVLPLLNKFEGRVDADGKEYIKLLSRSLNEITSPYIHRLESNYKSLTPREIEICNLIKVGMSSKEIALSLNTATDTVSNQRKTIRKKLKLTDRKANLAACLKSL
jgi:PAS domain S-box-containing protein